MSKTFFSKERRDLGLIECPADLSDESRLKEGEAAKPDAINPNHYQAFFLDYQWLETMQHLPDYRDPVVFKGAVKLQVRKYLDRCGRKDEELQELKKARWYLDFIIKYIENDNKPIRL